MKNVFPKCWNISLQNIWFYITHSIIYFESVYWTILQLFKLIRKISDFILFFTSPRSVSSGISSKLKSFPVTLSEWDLISTKKKLIWRKKKFSNICWTQSLSITILNNSVLNWMVSNIQRAALNLCVGKWVPDFLQTPYLPRITTCTLYTGWRPSKLIFAEGLWLYAGPTLSRPDVL